MNKIAIFGSSGFALEVADICYCLGYEEIILLSNDDKATTQVNTFRVIAESNSASLKEKGYVFAIGIGDSLIRKKIAEKYLDLSFPNLIHPSVLFGVNQLKKFELVRGNIITAGVIFTNSIKVGDFGLYNLNVSIGHDCIIEDFVSIMPSVTVSGNVHIMESAFLGAAATILQGTIENKMIIGRNSKVGAASLVTKNVIENVTVFGIPAKKLRC